MASLQQRRRQSRNRNVNYWPSDSPSTSSSSGTQTSNEDGDASPSARHPVPSMQAAFEESILDLKIDTGNTSDGAASPSSWKWKTRPRHSEHHQLLKLVSQIAFGIHLLHARLAKSDPEVVRILQNHVDDMDFFVASTTSDFDLAKSDIGQRLKHLRVPLDSGRASEVFDEMLQNREFRLDIVKGNENVEFVISRTAVGMNSALIDVREGLSAVDELAKYLLSLKKGWENLNLVKVYAAMTFNVEQWFRGLVALQTKGTGLREDLEQLRRVVREVERRTGIASRKNKSTITALHGKKSCPALTANINKPLPTPPTPDSVLMAIDIRTVFKHPRSSSVEKRRSPTIIITDEKDPPISQRLFNRPRTRSIPPEEQLGGQRRAASRARARPVPELWPEPLSARSGGFAHGEDAEDAKDFVFNPNNTEVKVKPKAPKEKGSKGSKRPDSCVIM